MQLGKNIKKKIIRDITISLFLYSLPVILMFLSFHITGKKPWLNQTKKGSVTSIHR